MACRRLSNGQLLTARFRQFCSAPLQATSSSASRTPSLSSSSPSLTSLPAPTVGIPYGSVRNAHSLADDVISADHTSNQHQQGGHEHSNGGNGDGASGRSGRRRLLLAYIPIPLIAFGYAKSEDEDGKEEEKPNVPELTPALLKKMLAEADKLHTEGEYYDEYMLLFPYNKELEAGILWRLARVTILCRDPQMPVGPYFEGCTRQALRLASIAKELEPENAMCQLWFGITLNHAQSFRYTGDQLTDVAKMFNAFTESIRLNPNIAYAWHCLGLWHFHVAKTSWLEWKAVEYSNHNLKRGTFEEALDCFVKAEELDPGFYMSNLNYMAWTYEKLGNKEKQIETLKNIVNFDSDNDLDNHNKQEAAIKLAMLIKKAK